MIGKIQFNKIKDYAIKYNLRLKTLYNKMEIQINLNPYYLTCLAVKGLVTRLGTVTLT